MKTQNLLILLFLQVLAAFVLSETETVFLRFPLAGMPVDTLPPPGSVLELHAEAPTPEHSYPVAVTWQGVAVGHVPARLAEIPYRLLLQGVALECQVHEHILPALPGHYLGVELHSSDFFNTLDLAQIDGQAWDGPKD